MSNFLPARLRTMRKIFEQEKLKRQQEAEIARANIDNPYQRACNQIVDFYRKYDDRFTEYFSEPREPSERKEFIKEMVIKNYNKNIKDSIDLCINLAIDEFIDGSYYIVNKTKNIKYENILDELKIDEYDEIILIKLKYVRGIIW